MIKSDPDRSGVRRLARDDFTAVWARRRIRQDRLDVIRANARSFLSALVVGAALVIGVALLIPWPFVRGLVVGIGITADVAMIGFLVLALSGTVARGMGTTAETWTASELRRLRRHGWRVINGLALSNRDVDHLLIGPAGVIVVETKWSATDWHLSPPDDAVLGAVQQVVANARSLRLWRVVKQSGMAVQPVVILWGGSKGSRKTEPLDIGNATVAYGLQAVRSCVEGIRRQPRTSTPEKIDLVEHELAEYVASRQANDPMLLPPPSFDRAIWTGTATLISFTATTIGCLETFTASHSWWLGLVTICGAFAVWLLAYRRWSAVRTPAIGGLLGVATVSTLAAASAVVAAFN